MPTPTNCYPWFHRSSQGVQSLTISSGCAVNGAGNIPCQPEAMRAAAEAKLRSLGYQLSLSLNAYTLARYMQGEVGNGTIEERVAVGEAAANRARMSKTDINGLLLYRQAPGHPNRGWYGPIHGIGTGTSTAPYGRWATTAADPTLLTLLLANLVETGATGNFAMGADDQDGPEAWISQGQTALNNYVKRLANSGKYWVGPLPGVDPWRTFLQITPGIPVSSIQGQALLARGLAALQLPRRAPDWSPNLPVCDKPAGSGVLTFTVLGGLFAGMLAFVRGWFRNVGHRE